MSDLRQQRGQRGEDEAVRFLEARGFRVVVRNWRPGQNNATQSTHSANAHSAAQTHNEYSNSKQNVAAKRSAAADGAMRGEIDCIAWHDKILCFIEVKTRHINDNDDASTVAPQEAVTFSKQKQVSRLANAYVSFHRLHDVACRFDVVEVWLQKGHAPRVVHHANAFDYVDPSYGARLASRNRRF